MGVTLAAYVQAPTNDPYAAQCATEAAAMVATHLGTVTVPPSVLERAVLEVGAELYHRRQSRNGISQMQDLDMAPMRIARDPLKAAYDILRPYTGPALA